MSTEESSFVTEAATNMLQELQSWWEIPSLAQYISLFREPFHLPEIEIEELEKGFIDDTVKGPNEWLQNLIIAFLKSIMPSRINNDNWEDQLRKLVRRKWSESPFAEKENPFQDDIPFHQLQLRSKVEVLYSFCLYRLDRNDTAELMKSMDAEALRVQKLGFDDLGHTYWYFYGTRLYKEEANEEKKSWDEEWKEQKKKSFKKKRGRGRPRKHAINDGESDSEIGKDNLKDNGFMNISEKSRWSVACDTLEEWVNFAEKFKNSKSKNEKSLFQIIQENFLPTLSKIYEEKEKKLQQKVRELLPAREKIVTRRETRRLRGENVDFTYTNGYASDDDDYKPHVVKDRAQRLEERNKRASEAEGIDIVSRKRPKQNKEDDESSFLNRSEYENMDLQSQMERLLSSVKLHKDAWPFLYPVNEEDAPGYYEIIKNPIDLSKIESKLYKGEYETVGDLDADFSQMVSNCELYNGEYHGYSKMAQTLRKVFRKQVSKILDSMETVENGHADSEEGSSDSQYSSSNSTPPHDSPVVSSKEHKKAKDGKRKRKNVSEALDLLAQASDFAVQNSNSNDMLNISNIFDEQKKCNDFPSLKILPIHSHPSSFIEKYGSNASKESPKDDSSHETSSSYLNQETDNNGLYLRSSPADSAISTSSETTNYMNNLAHLASFIEKDGVKNLNFLSNSDLTNVLSDADASINTSNGSPQFSKESNTSANPHSFDNMLNEYSDNFISHLTKPPSYNSVVQLNSQSKDNCSPPYAQSLPKQDVDVNKNVEKSSYFTGHQISNNTPPRENADMQYDLGSPSSNITTIDASVLGITVNSMAKKPRNSSASVMHNPANFASNGNTVPNSSHEESTKTDLSFRPKQRTPPNEMSQYYQSPNFLNYNQPASAPNTSYPSLSMDISNAYNNVPTTYIQTLATNSTSNVFVPTSFQKPVQQQQAKIEMQSQNNALRFAVPQSNNPVMFVPEPNKGSMLTYHLYAQNKPNQNLLQQPINHLPSGTAATMHMASDLEKRTFSQDNITNRTTPPQKKSPIPQESQPAPYHVPSTHMPYNPISTSSSSVTNTSFSVTNSSLVSSVQAPKKSRPLIIKAKASDFEKRTSPIENVAATSFNTVSSVNKNIPQQNNVYQQFSPKTVPVVLSGFNHNSGQNDIRIKNNPISSVTMQSPMTNGLPVVQQVIIPAGSQQIQIPGNGQFLLATPQNTVRLFNKEQNVQIQNNVGHLNHSFGKVIPQIVTSTPVMQVSKDGLQNLQFQAVSPTNAQTFTQVGQNQQFVNIPYMLSNQNASPQSVMNLQPYQLSPRQMQIGGQGSG